MHVSVVIPAWNEEKRIGKTMQMIRNYFEQKGIAYEIVVPDDGSTDKTREVAKRNGRAEVIPLTHRGKGHAVREGVKRASGEFILVTDADLSTPIEEFDHLKAVGADVAIGSRALPGATFGARQPRYREIGGRILNAFIRLTVLPGIKDTQCGFKLFRAASAKEIFRRTTIDGFGFDIEALFIARTLGYRISEIPIRWSNDDRTKVRPFRNGITMLADLIRIRLNNLKGKYN